MFACFCPSKKPLFSLFRQILPFQAEIQKIKKCVDGVTKPDILHPRSSKLMKEKYPNMSVTDGQKKTTSFFARVMTSSNRIKSNLARVFPYVDDFFIEKIFRIGSPVPEILFKNCYPRPSSNFIKGIFNALNITNNLVVMELNNKSSTTSSSSSLSIIAIIISIASSSLAAATSKLYLSDRIYDATLQTNFNKLQILSLMRIANSINTSGIWTAT